jgi:hypothetical protein
MLCRRTPGDCRSPGDEWWIMSNISVVQILDIA